MLLDTEVRDMPPRHKPFEPASHAYEHWAASHGSERRRRARLRSRLPLLLMSVALVVASGTVIVLTPLRRLCLSRRRRGYGRTAIGASLSRSGGRRSRRRRRPDGVIRPWAVLQLALIPSLHAIMVLSGTLTVSAATAAATRLPPASPLWEAETCI